MGISPARTALTLTALALLAAIAIQAPRQAQAQSSPESHPIVAAAIQRAGTHGGQCYTFVQDVVRDVTGRHIGMGYRQGFLSAGGIEIDPANARAGDVLQIANPNDTGNYYPGMHTVIVIENLGNRTYKVVDSNWQWNERVAVHNWTARRADHLKLYAYRFPVDEGNTSLSTGSDSGTSGASGSTAQFTAGDGARVEPGSCLRLRGGAGLGNQILDCLSAGTSMTVLSGVTVADGYSWVQVELASGERGWVASEFLDPAPAPASSQPDPTPTPEPTQAPDPTPTPEPAPQVSTATVDAPGSCLYLRRAANLGGAIQDCLVHGTPVEILEEGGSADGYNWVRVELRYGSGSGWVASEYLARD